jgi:hypothetical protein
MIQTLILAASVAGQLAAADLPATEKDAPPRWRTVMPVYDLTCPSGDWHQVGQLLYCLPPRGQSNGPR